MEERLENFLKELTELTHKYNLAIGGCGCCLSPYIMDEFQEKQFYYGDLVCGELEYDLETKKYKVEALH